MSKHEDREENSWQEGMSVTETKKYKEVQRSATSTWQFKLNCQRVKVCSMINIFGSTGKIQREREEGDVQLAVRHSTRHFRNQLCQRDERRAERGK